MDNNINNPEMTIEDLVQQFSEGGTQQQQQADSNVPANQPEADEPAPINTPPVQENFFDVFEEKLLKSDLLQTYSLDEEGNQFFVPKNTDEFVELLQANKEQWIAEARNEDKNALLGEIFQEATPALRFLAENANKFSKVESMIEFAQSVRNEEVMLSLDVTNPEHQEEIVRQVLKIQGLDQNSIEEEIIDLKDRNKLEVRAQKLKPSLDGFHANITAQILQRQEEENMKEQNFWRNYYQNFQTQLLDSPHVEGLKLKKEDKARIAPLLLPAQDGSGLPIYNKIDEAVGQGDITTLTLIGLLLENREGFYNYMLDRDSSKISKDLQKKLRSVGGFKTSSENLEQSPKQTPGHTSQYGAFL